MKTHVINQNNTHYARRTFCGKHSGFTMSAILPRKVDSCTEKQWDLCEDCVGRMAMKQLAEIDLEGTTPPRQGGFTGFGS